MAESAEGTGASRNSLGLHARTAIMFQQMASQYDCQIAVISSAPTTLIATATTSASATVNTSFSRSGSMPEARARSSFRVAVNSAGQRQATSAEPATPRISTIDSSR